MAKTVVAYVGSIGIFDNLLSVQFEGEEVCSYRPRYGRKVYILYKTPDDRLILGVKTFFYDHGFSPSSGPSKVVYTLHEVTVEDLCIHFPGLAQVAGYKPYLTLEEALSDTADLFS